MGRSRGSGPTGRRGKPGLALCLLLASWPAPPLAAGAPAAPVTARQEAPSEPSAVLAEAQGLFERAEAARAAGDTQVATEHARTLVGLVSAPGVVDSLEADRLLWNAGVLLRRCGALDAAIDAQAIVAERRARLEPTDPERLYAAHYSVAYHAEKAGRFDVAADHFEGAFHAGRELRAADDEQLLEIRSRVGRSLFRAHRLEAARDWTRATLEDNERMLGPLHPHVRLARNDLCFVLTELGEYEAALALNAEALEAAEQLPAGTGNRAWILQQRGDLQRRLSDLEGALDSYRAALAGFEAADPQRPMFIMLAKHRVGAALEELGHFEEARRQLESTIAYARQVGEYDADTRVSLTNTLASTHLALGNVVRARALYESVLYDAEGALPPGEATRTDVLTGLARCKLLLGDELSALELFERDLDATIDFYGEEHPFVAVSRSNLAVALGALGRYGEAAEIQVEVVEAHRKKFGDDHRRTTVAQLNLAALELRRGDAERAFELAEPAFERRSRQLAEHDPAMLEAMGTLAAACAATGRLERANELYARRLRVYERTRPAHDLDVIGSRQALVHALVDTDRTGEATALATEQLRSMRQAVRGALGHSSARELEAFSSRLRGDVAELLVRARGPLEGLDAELFTTIETLRAASAVAGALAALDPSGRAKPTDTEREAALALAAAVRRGAAPAEITAAHAQLEQLRRARQERLAELPGASGLLADPAPPALSSAMDGGVALAYHVHRAPGSAGELLVHVIDAGGELHRLDLGPLDAIAGAAADWRAAMGVGPGGTGLRGVRVDARPAGGSEPAERAAGARLRELVWDPVLDLVGDAGTVLVVRDGPLVTVPLDALPVPDGRLGDRFVLEQRSTLHEILWQRPAPASGVVLAVGGVAFSRAPLGPDAAEPHAGEAPPPAGAPALLRGSPWESGFSVLAATEGEARTLVGLAEELDVAETRLLCGARASREAVESLAPGTRYLHLATHGWFSPAALARRPEPGSTRLSRAAQVEHVSPLALCGVALAGANLPPDELGRAPGLVTAEEIASWDLGRCELAVLSACETSVGIVDDGVGAASLQKAFHVAGARTVVASLWQVPDEATRQLMNGFYTRLWSGTPKARALWEAKAELRGRVGPGGRPLFGPRDWAAWVLTGDPR